MKLAGANYKEVPPTEAVVDGNLVTTPAWPGHQKWLAEFLKVLGTEITHGKETGASGLIILIGNQTRNVSVRHCGSFFVQVSLKYLVRVSSVNFRGVLIVVFRPRSGSPNTLEIPYQVRDDLKSKPS